MAGDVPVEAVQEGSMQGRELGLGQRKEEGHGRIEGRERGVEVMDERVDSIIGLGIQWKDRLCS